MGKKKRQIQRIQKFFEKEQKAKTKKLNDTKKSSNKIKEKPKAKRKPNDLQKLYERGKITQKQYASGERLILDYELSFRNKSCCDFKDEANVQKSNRNNNEFFLIQNLHAWERYSHAIMSIKNLQTREIVKMFCIEGLGLTQIDKKLGKNGVAEVRLWYGLNGLWRFYLKKKY